MVMAELQVDRTDTVILSVLARIRVAGGLGRHRDGRHGAVGGARVAADDGFCFGPTSWPGISSASPISSTPSCSARKRLFGTGTIPRTFRLLKSTTSPTGVLIATYERRGKVETGSFALDEPTGAEVERRRNLNQTGSTR
jgi:hypothetical protein